MLELAEEHLARAGDRLDDAFAFLDELGYCGVRACPRRGAGPVKTRHDGEDPTA